MGDFLNIYHTHSRLIVYMWIHHDVYFICVKFKVIKLNIKITFTFHPNYWRMNEGVHWI